MCGWPGTDRDRTSTCTVKVKLYAWNRNYNYSVYQDSSAYCNIDKIISTCVINTAAADGPAPVRPGYTQAQCRSIWYAWNMIYNAYLSTCGYWNVHVKIKTQKYNIQMGNQCSAPCLWKAWHLTGPGHPLAQWILIPYVWNIHYNVFQWICGYWNLDKQYSVRWSDLSLCMAWHIQGKDIHRHSEDQIHMHDRQIIVLIRVQMECWDLLKNNIQLGDQHQIWGWPDT